MVALRYICGFFIQICPYAFFCLYPFWDRFCINRKKVIIIALSVLTVLAIPFSLIGQFNIGGNYEELFCNIIFYVAVIFFLALYLKAIRTSIAEKLFVFFLVMSYGFLITRIMSFLSLTFDLQTDKFMYPPIVLLMTLGINLLAAKPIMALMDRVRIMSNAKIEARIWRVLCVIPVLFMLIASAAYFSELISTDNDILISIYSILFTIFALIMCAVIFRIMDYIHRQQEEYRNAERMLESYRNQAENNELIHEIHHEIKHHLNALSVYLEQKDYVGAEQYLKKFAKDTERLPATTYTAHPLINSILAEFAGRAKQEGIEIEYNIIVGSKLNMDDVDLCRVLANILENAVEGCEKVPQAQRFIRFKLHSKGNFLYLNCENSCNESSLKSNNGRYITTKKDKNSHGFGLRIIGKISEKYNGILMTQVKNNIFTATTNLCLINESAEE